MPEEGARWWGWGVGGLKAPHDGSLTTVDAVVGYQNTLDVDVRLRTGW
jgi:hypothetical protein